MRHACPLVFGEVVQDLVSLGVVDKDRCVFAGRCEHCAVVRVLQEPHFILVVVELKHSLGGEVIPLAIVVEV